MPAIDHGAGLAAMPAAFSDVAIFPQGKGFPCFATAEAV
jgi:hypothetical protein